MEKEFIRILQCSDIHFDTPFLGLSQEEREMRKEELRETFSTIIELSKEKKVHLLLIPGDLFDNRRVSKITIDFIIEKLKSIPEVMIFIAPGNHDPYDNSSFYNIVKWPKNVYVFKDKIEKIYIDALKTYVYGVGFQNNHLDTSLLSGFNVKTEDDMFHIMVIHGDIVNECENSIYNPIYLSDIKNSNLHYLAIGHKHSYNFDKIGKTYYCYSGNPEGRSFNEVGEKGVVYVNLYKDFCESEFIPVCKRKYLVYKLDISDCNNYEKIKEKVLSLIDEVTRKKDIIRIILCGYISKEFLININLLKKKLQMYFHYIEFVDETKVNILESEFIKGSLRELYYKSLQERLGQAKDEPEKKILEEALILGLKALMDEEV